MYKFRSQSPRGLRCGSAAAYLLGMRVRIPVGGMNVCCECCALSGRSLCDGLVTRPEESYRLWCVVVCDLEISWGAPASLGGCCAQKKSTSLQPISVADLGWRFNQVKYDIIIIIIIIINNCNWVVTRWQWLFYM